MTPGRWRACAAGAGGVQRLLPVREACPAVEQRFGLRRAAPGDRAAACRPIRAETDKAQRRAPSLTREAAEGMWSRDAIGSMLNMNCRPSCAVGCAVAQVVQRFKDRLPRGTDRT